MAAAICSIVTVYSSEASGDARWHYEGDLTVRAVAVAEGLAIRESSGIVADPATTDTFAADLAAIYAIYPGLAAATPLGDSPHTIIIDVDPSVSPETVLSSLPTEAGFERYTPSFHNWIALEFSETINAVNLAAWVQVNVPGIRGAQPDGLATDGNDVIYHSAEDLYAFKIGEGDCLGGCLEEFWRFVLMSAEGPVEIGSDELDAVFSGELSTAVLPSLKVAPGDWLEVANLSRGRDVKIVRENAYGREEIRDAYIDFGSASSAGTYEISVNRPYGLAPVIHSVEVSVNDGPSLMTGERFLNGWVSDADFGWTYDQAGPWQYHADHGWIYTGATSANGAQAWVFDRSVGWLSFDRQDYPWVCGAEQGWMYYQPGTHAPRYFFKTATASWWAVE